MDELRLVRCPPAAGNGGKRKRAGLPDTRWVKNGQKASIAQEVGKGQPHLAAQSGSQGFCSSEETYDVTNSVELDWESLIDWGIKFTR